MTVGANRTASKSGVWLENGHFLSIACARNQRFRGLSAFSGIIPPTEVLERNAP
jgi:hypothetical protein